MNEPAAVREQTRSASLWAESVRRARRSQSGDAAGALEALAGSMPRWRRDAMRRRMLAAADLISAALAGFVLVIASDGPLAIALAAAPLWLLLAKLLGLYDRDHRAIRHLTIDELPGIAAWAAGGVILVVLLIAPPVTAATAAEAWGVAAGGAVVLRGTARWLWRRLTPRELTLVVGDGEPAAAIHRRAGLFEDMHLQLIQERPLPLPELGVDEGKLAELVGDLDRIIVASTEIDPELIGRLAATCRAQQVKLSVVSPLRGRALPALRISQVADLPVFEFNTWDPSRSTMLLKRVFDLVFAVGALLVTAPLFPLIAIAIRLDTRGPTFFSQTRAGLNGRPFRLYKFRTMQAGAEEQLPSVIDLDQLDEPMFKLNGDPRVTRVGRFLRRHSLDELPQFLNVIRGDMSIVGPRPEQVELVERYLPEHRFRLDVKPGVTGPMQVHGRGELTFAERLAVELEYVENLSLARDLKILARTVPAVLRGAGAY